MGRFPLFLTAREAENCLGWNDEENLRVTQNCAQKKEIRAESQRKAECATAEAWRACHWSGKADATGTKL